MNNFLNGFIKKCKRWGFTLAEALVVTVMAGYAILPILGTMQNASKRAEAYDHRSKMVQYTRSRLTKEIANASFDHCAVSTEDMYHYIVYFDPTGDENKAVRMEIPETYINPDELLTIKGDTTVASGVCDLFGLNSDITPSAYMKIIYAYRTSVQTNDGILLATYTEDISTTTTSEPGPKGLLGIVVTTRLVLNEDIPYNDDGVATGTGIIGSDYEVVAPVSNFSLVNLPTVSDEYIWVCDSLNLKLLAIDPVSKTVASTISLEREPTKADKPEDNKNNSYRPWRIALHPSGKIMVVLMKNNIMMVNLDKKSPDYGTCKKLLSPSSSSDFCTPENKAEKSIEDGGVAFRPDGKYLFLTKKGEKKLLVFSFEYEINASTKALDWSKVKMTAKTDVQLDAGKDKYVGLVPASNGYLYIAYKDVGVYRTSMYPPNDDFVTQWSNPAKIGYLSYGKDLMGIAVSPAGNILAVVLDDKDASADNVLIFDANTGALLDKKAYDDVCRPAFVANANATNGINDRTLTLNVTNKECKEDVIATSLAIGNDRNEDYGKYKSSLNNGGPGKGGGPADKKFKGYQIIPSPITGELVINEKDKPHLIFTKSNTEKVEETHITNDNRLELATGKGPKVDNSISDIAAIPRDILAVSSSGTITLYDMNVMKRIEDNQIIATDTPTELSMSPNGEMVIGSYGSKRSGATPFYLSDYSSGPDLSVGTGEIKKHVFDDRSQNMLFFLKEDSSGTPTASSTAIYNMNADFASDGDWACSTDSIYFRGDFKLSNGWKRLDMIGLPKGGYMALFGKSDGTSMLEWVGRIPREYPVNANKYSLFARWVNVSKTNTITKPAKADWANDNQVDDWKGKVFCLREQFPVDSVIDGLTATSGITDSSTSYVTPLILSGNLNELTIEDYATTAISFKKGDTDKKVNLTWKNGGRIKANDWFVGFYSGRVGGSVSKGAIAYEIIDSGDDYTFIADYYPEGSDMDDENGFAITDSNYKTTNFKQYASFQANGKARKYKISFHASDAKNGCSFPPSHSKKLAVTYDMGTLAVLSGEDTAGGATPTVSLYDFNSSNFLNETQIEGMLVDYREKFQSGIYDESTKELKTAPVYPWPNEEESLFKSVLDEGRIITDFKSVTTKYDTFTPFNQFPANYVVDTDSVNGIKKVKGNANKRVFGYISDDKDFTNLQGIPSEDSRFFYNNKILGGRLEQSGEALYEPSLYIGLNPYQSGLLQLDQTSNGQKNRSAIFLGKKDADSPSSYLANQGDNKILNKDYSVCGWNTLRSDQTYILKNQPTLMKSFVAKDNGSPAKILGINYAEMMFSRDKAQPVLYISDKANNCFWALGKNPSNNFKLIRFNMGSVNTTGAMAISIDGTKLFVGCSAEATTSTGGTGTKASAKKNEIRVYNIAKPDTSVFNVSSLVKDLSTAPSPNAATYTAYLGTMSADASPVAMAAMPFVNYSTAGAVGTYTPISNATLNGIPVAYNGCMTIASGGLYIFPATTGNASRTILLYNPADSKLTALSDVLKAPAPFSPITSYDDTLYVMGDDADGSKPTNRVQSYSVNERKAKTSIIEEPDVFNDSYMVNSVYKSGETDGVMTIRSGETSDIEIGVNIKDLYVFDGNNKRDEFWKTKIGDLLGFTTNDKTKWISYSFNNFSTTANKIVIDNDSGLTNSYNLEDWSLYGLNSIPNEGQDINYGAQKRLAKGSCSSRAGITPFVFTNSNTYTTYLLHAEDVDSIGASAEISEIELWRTGVKRLLPVIGSISVVYLDNDKGAFQPGEIPSNSPLEGMKWSPAPASSKNLGLADIFANNNDGKKNTLRGYSSSTANDCTQWKNIIEYSGTGQRYKSTANYPWIICKFKKSESVSVVRYANFGNTSGKGGIKKFKLFGSNTTDAAPNTSDGSVPSGWEPITFTNGGEEFTGPGTAEGGTGDAYVYNSYITAEIMNPQPYRYYLMQITGKLKDGFSLAGLEMFSSDSKIGIDGDYLTGLETDERGAVKVGAGACCATPYGLVYTGGHVAESGYATSTALLYWPHAIDKYDGTYYKNGISRSLPSLGQARYNHAMVWLKGKIYCVGGAKDSSYTAVGINQFFEYLPTINTGAGNLQWEYISDTDINNPDSTLNNQLPRYYHGCCAWGDEIFIFGGQSGSSSLKTAFAYNPETTDLRQLANLPIELSPCCAVAYGSKIYIIGKNGGKNYMYEYTP